MRAKAPVTIVLLVLTASISAESADEIDRLAPLRFLVGYCWQGVFPDGEHVDKHCYEEMYGKAFIRDTHLVKGTRPDYRGETIYQWDADQEQITFRYWNSVGGMSDGTAILCRDELQFPAERHVREDGTILEIQSVIRPIGEDKYISIAREKADGDWKEIWRIEFSRIGPVTSRAPAETRVR